MTDIEEMVELINELKPYLKRQQEKYINTESLPYKLNQLKLDNKKLMNENKILQDKIYKLEHKIETINYDMYDNYRIYQDEINQLKQKLAEYKQ